MFGRTTGQRTNLWFIALVAVVTLALAGCGGRSGSMSGASGPGLSEVGGADPGSGPIDPAHAPSGGMPAPGGQLDPAAPAGGSPGQGAGSDGLLGTADDVPGGEAQAPAGPDGQIGTADDAPGNTGPAGLPAGQAGDPPYDDLNPLSATDYDNFRQVSDGGGNIKKAFVGAVAGCYSVNKGSLDLCANRAAWLFKQVKINIERDETTPGCQGSWGDSGSLIFRGNACGDKDDLERQRDDLLNDIDNTGSVVADVNARITEVDQEEQITAAPEEVPKLGPIKVPSDPPEEPGKATATACPEGTANCPPPQGTGQYRARVDGAAPPGDLTQPLQDQVPGSQPQPAPVPVPAPAQEPAQEPAPEPAPEPEPEPAPEPQDEDNEGGEGEQSKEGGGEDSGDGQSDGSDD